MQNVKCKMQNVKPAADGAQRRVERAPAARPPRDLSERLLEFAAHAGKVVNSLLANRMGRHIAGQFVRSGTSPGPNYEEACVAESRADFVHKLSICLKELRESRFWIRLIVRSDLLSAKKTGDIEDESAQLCKIIAQSLVTAKKNARNAAART